MNNEMRERFYQEIKNAFIKIGEGKFSAGKAIELADALIEAGLIFNPETDIRMKFKKGQEVWFNSIDKGKPIPLKISKFYPDDIIYEVDNWGNINQQNLFVTEAEAQAALEEGK